MDCSKESVSSSQPEDNQASHRLNATLLGRVYDRVVLSRPVLFFLVMVLAIVSVLRYTPQFELDASADSLTLEDDKDLAYYRASRQNFPSTDDYLLIAFTPTAPLFSEPVITKLQSLKQDLLRVPQVKKINSVLDVPILNDPEMSLTNVSEHLGTLEDGYQDWSAAQAAFTSNPFYRDLLVSQDGRTTAIQVVLKTDSRSAEAVASRNALRSKARQAPLEPEEANRLAQLELEVKDLNHQAIEAHREAVDRIRAVVHQYNDIGTLFLGGIPMIVVDMLDYVRSDVGVFGLGVVVFLVLMLSILFRRLLWVVMPLFCVSMTCWVMVGFLGFLRFPVTVISSNFIALLLIITMSMIIHLIVRYRELVDRYPQWTQRALIAETVGQMARPCLYTSLTTVVAFVSLLVSNIRPVIDFGIMMTMGIAFSYATAFLLFPVLLSFFAREPGDVKRQQSQDVFSVKFANLTMRMGGGLTVAALVLGVFSAWGISRLSVENRFIDYFKEKTEIYQGMKTIDEHLGGTTPLDIILDVKLKGDLENDQEDCFLDDDCLDDVYGDSTIFTQAHMAQFRDIHTWLEALPETGKVLSVITTIELAEQIKGASLNALELAFLNAMFPDDLRGLLLDPYVNEATGKVRFTLRVRESDTELKRQAL
ncbi:MAG: MMPL family transporter, partial [Gammaproteobacteria bacterium]